MNILILTSKPPNILNNGTCLRANNIAKSMITKNIEIHLLTLVFSDNHIKLLKSLQKDNIFSSISYVRLNKKTHKNIELARIFSTVNLSSITFGKDFLNFTNNVEYLNKVIEKQNISVIIVFGHSMGLMASYATEKPRWILDLVDSQALQLRRRLIYTTGFSKIWLLFNFLRQKQNEKYLLQKYKDVVVVSPEDTKFLKNCYRNANIHTISNGIDCSYFSKLKVIDQKLKEPTIAFWGNLNFPPNSTAILWFCDNVFPYVISSIPNVKLILIGKYPQNNFFKKLNENKNIKMLNFVNDIRPIVLASNVAIVPMQIGCGIKNKILEAMALSIPVVSTTLALEAFDETIRKLVCVADRPKDFSNYVINLLQNEQKCRILGEEGRKYVCKKYSWNYVSEKYTTLFN